ncbi:MAG TPA: O-antigen ligase family protein [Bryobacteraceae bacterium]|nr:O-antigen ligase family protein [Bryobacteraceae bacterium]
MIEARRLLPPHGILISLAIGGYAAVLASSQSLSSRAALAGVPLLAIVAFWTLAAPHRWIAGFMASALLLPPLPIALGNSGPHPSLLFAALGILAGALYIRAWRIAVGRLPLALVCLFCILLGSVAFAALYSGPAIALQTLARVLLFGIGVYVFFYVAYLCRDDHPPAVRLMFWAAMASAAIACVDFYYQLPAPAGFGPQFIWTATGYYRRAQGIFYEASTLGNLCVFFLVMIAVAFSRRPKLMPVSRPVLVLGGVLFSAALIFSYSRASIVNLVVALAALGWLDRRSIHWRRALSLLGISITAGAAASYYFLPQIVESSWQRLSGSAIYLFDYGEAVFSGRFESWRTLLRFLNEHPWHAVFGIGYKTLPYSDYIGQSVIGDNMYLSMLIETGVIGLAALIWFNVAILLASRRAARQANPKASFFGTWMFCFWLGQCVQMLSADLLTYWRVLPVYFLVLAWTVRESATAPAQ